MKIEQRTISGYHNSSLRVLGTYAEEKVKKTLRVRGVGDSEEKVFYRHKEDRYDYELTGAVTRCTELA